MPFRLTTRLFLAAAALFAQLGMAAAQGFETPARAAWVYDLTSDTLLFAKNADEPLPPASMSKLMTLYLAFEAVANGRLTLEETLPVSEHAASYGGSSMFLDPRDRPSVSDLLHGTIVLSGNDSAAVLAEALSPDGTEAGFARLMTERAVGLGMTASHFVNSNGWPADGQLMSVHDLGVLAEHLIRDYPTFYPIFSEQEFLYDGRVPSNTQNRNPILGLGIGADGLKTGHTEAAGYGLVGSAEQNGRRIVFVVTGLSSAAERASEGEKILTWAFRNFAMKTMLHKDEVVATTDVWMGAVDKIDLTVAADVSVLMPLLGVGDIEAQIVYRGPIAAPIVAGTELADLVFTPPGLSEIRVPLVAATDVEPAGVGKRIGNAAAILMSKFAPGSAE